MPTGYTVFLQDHPEATLADFAWCCARAFGMCIMQRDDPYDAPINLKEKPSAFYLEKLNEAKSKLKELNNISEKEWNKKEKIRVNIEYNRMIEKDKECENIVKIYQKMLVEVENWSPPKGLEGIKDFMIQQLKESIKWDGPFYKIHPDRLPKARTLIQEKQNCLENINRYEKYWEEEVDRVNARNDLKKELLKSVGKPNLVKLSW